MSLSRKAEIFSQGARAVRLTLAHGKSTAGEIRNINRARQTLFAFIRELTSKKPKYKPYLERAMHALHPRTEYCVSMLIRDVADVCVTLNRLEQGRRRTDRTKLLDAQLLCEYLVDELRQQSQGT